MEKYNRPLDMLNQHKNKSVLVALKNGKNYSGTLLAFDLNINIVLDNAHELENSQIKQNLGLIFFRGDAVVYVSPVK